MVQEDRRCHPVDKMTSSRALILHTISFIKRYYKDLRTVINATELQHGEKQSKLTSYELLFENFYS